VRDLTVDYFNFWLVYSSPIDGIERWSHFVTQPAKVDSPMQRMIHHEDAETVFG
jgi:hypothetical protein